jgi:VWFA-related protein
MSVVRLGIFLAALYVAAGDNFAILSQAPTFTVNVRVVNVLATVRERKGRIVSDLSKDEFILQEDGKPQQIQYFSRQTDLPLILGLLVDTSMSQRSLIEDERSASFQFLNQVLHPERDQAFLIKFDYDAELLQDLTNSRNSLKKALDGLETPGFGQPGRGQRRGGGRKGGAGHGAGIGTILFDSVFLASDEVLQKQEGRKAIILISDGVDNGSKLGARDAIEAAQRADTLIYSIRYYDPDMYGFGAPTVFGRSEDKDGKNALKSLSNETGGRMFEVTKKMKLTNIYDTIQEELRNQYYLGYTPSENGVAGFRRITLRTKIPNLEVITRAGYYAKN